MSVALPPIDQESYNQHREGRFAERTQAEDQRIASLGALEQGEAQRVQQSEAAFAQRTAQEDAAIAQHAVAEQQPERDFAARTAREDADLAAAAQAEQRTVRAPAGSFAAASQGEQAAAGAGNPLGRVYADARRNGLDDEGARAAVAVAATEHGYEGALGDAERGGSAGTFQLFHGGGMGDEYARQQGLTREQSIARLRADPHGANDWALRQGGYLGDVIREGQAKGLRGAALAEYAQRVGQRSVAPERAATNYTALQGQSFDQTGADAVLGPGPAPGQEAAQFARARTPGRAEAVGQFEQGLSYAEAAAICGPVAALAFAQANGRNPSLAEARAFAVKRGWTAAGGMNGVANEQALLSDLGVKSRLDTSPDFGEIAHDAASGNPVIISTPVHYWYVSGYRPETGELYVGKTGTSRRGGSAWMTPQQIAQLDGGINGALYVDNPQSPTPSVAAADTSGERPPSEFEPPPFVDKSFAGQPDAVVAEQPADEQGMTPDRPPFGMEGLLNLGPFGVRTPTLPPIVPPNLAPPDQGEQERVLEGRSPVETGGELVGKVSGFLGRQVQSQPGAIAEGLIPDAEATVRHQEARGGFGGGRFGDLVSGVGEAVSGGPGGLEGTAKKAAGEVERLRLDKFPEEAQATVERAAGRGDFWQQQRRNVISDAEAEKMADELGRTIDQVVAGGRAGRAYNTEETRALRNGLVAQALKVDDLKATAEALGDKASDALRRQLGEEEARLLALSRIAEGARAEAGRTFRAYLMDTRSRLLRARGPEYTNVSRVPIRAAPELGPGVEQAGFVRDPELHRPPVDPGPAAPELGRGVQQSTYVGPVDYYREPVDPGPRAAPAPGSRTPALTEQAPLITEPVATSGRATNLLGQTTRVGAARLSVYDRASLVRMAGMLSGVPTHLLNAAGNVVQGGATLLQKEGQVAADLARVGIGRALGRDVQRTRFQAEVGPQVAGYARGLWAGVQQVPAVLRGNLPQDFARAYDARGLQSGSKVVDAAVEAPLRALAASDAVFRSAAFGGHAAALATRQATREGLSGAARSRRVEEILGNISDYPVLLENANQLAARDVFQEARVETDAIARFKQQHAGARVVGDVFLPFYKTPYNVAAQGAGMTPAGYLGALAAARRGETGEAVDRVVRATVGTMALGAGLELARGNLLTGAYPADAADRSTLPEGWKPYSLRVPSGDGAVYVPIQSLGALAVPLGAAAVVVDAEKRGMDKNDLMKGVYAGLGGIGQFMGDMSALQGLNAVFKLVTAPERTAESFSESLGASFVPGSAFARQVQQMLGDAARDPTGPVEAFMAGIPGLSRFVPEKTTPLGDTRSRGPSGPAALVAGGRIGVEQDDPALATLRRVGVGIPADPTDIEGVPLTPEEQAAVRQLAGERIRAAVARLAANDRVAAVSPAVRADIYRNAVAGAREQAKSVVWKRIGADEIRRRRAAQPTGVR